MSDEPAELRQDLLDDFFAECDEQLTNVRAQLATLEHGLATGPTDPAALESLYRSIHSFKGNAAIVGLSPAEQLAHTAESVLRALTRRELVLGGPVLELLARVGNRLEQMIAAFRLHQPIPAVADLLPLLESYGPAAASRTPAEPPVATAAPVVAVAASVDEAPAAGRQIWRAIFTPSPQLDQRGVNVGSVRTRLAALGEIAGAKPQIQPGGRVAFEFTVALNTVPTDLAAWEADGVVLRPAAPASATTPEAEAAAAAAAPTSLLTAPSHIVRVDLSRLDELMRITGDLVILRSRLHDRIAEVSGDTTGLQEVNVAMTRALRDLRAAIMRVRLVPVLEIFGRLPFVVRDLGRETGKNIRLLLEGQGTEIDKYIVERLKEPLLHLVRNAVSHGIETPAERSASGKPAEATLLLRASTVGDSVHIEIRDDGRGVDASQVAERARAAGLAVADQVDEVELLRLICLPGFSTRENADRASGRGVGMAVVESTVRELAGSVSLRTVPGKFTQFTLRLPLTLSIAEALIVSAGSELCAVPQASVHEIVQLATAEMHTVNRIEVGPYRGGLLPLIRLRKLFGAASSDSAQVPVLVVQSERGATGLVVDRVHGQREVVVRPMHDPLVRVPGVSGATELGDGRPVLILDTATLPQAASAGPRGAFAALQPVS